MATPVGDSYGVASGGVIAAGRHYIGGNQRIAIWGQSNAKGGAYRTGINASPLSADPQLAAWDSGTFERVYIWDGSAYSKLQPSVNNGASTGYFGPEFGLAVRWMRETASGNLYIDKQAFGGVGISYFDPADWNYTTMLNAHYAANSWLTSHGVTISDTGWLWVQGESDASSTQAYYQPRLEALISENEVNGIAPANKPRLLAKQHPSTIQYGVGPQDAKDAIASASPSNTTTFTLPFTEMMEGDSIHLNARGQLQLGYYVFEKLFNTVHKDA